MNFDFILGKFEHVKRNSNGSYNVSCPLPAHKHGDKKPSLTITEKEDRIDLYCFVCGKVAKEVFQAIEIEEKYLFKKNWDKEEYSARPLPVPGNGNNGKSHTMDYIRNYYNPVEAEYDYYDEKCNLTDRKLRHKKKGYKDFAFCHPVGKDKWNFKKSDTPGLHGLLEIIEAKKRGVKLFGNPEGEKDADTLLKIGIPSFTSGGVNTLKEEHIKILNKILNTDDTVLIFWDYDTGGVKDKKERIELYSKAIFKIKVIDLPGLIIKENHGEDITDWLQAGHTKEELRELVKNTPLYVDLEIKEPVEGKPLPPRPEGAREQEPEQKQWEPLEDISFKDFIEKKYEPIKFLVEGILPEGLSILSGSPKIGKTFFALNMALSIATGEKTLGHLSTEKVGVAYIAMDEKDQYIQEKLNCIREFQQRNVIPDNFRFIFEINRLSEGGHEQLLDYIDRHPEIKLIVIDTLGRFRKPAGGKGNAYEVDVESIGQIQDICKKKNVSILLLHHNKKGKSEDYVENLSGSMGISGTVDTILGLERARFEDEGTLKVTPRIGEGKDLSVKFNKDLLCWEILGDAEIYSQSKERREIIDILKKENSPMSNKDLSGLLNKNYNAIKYLTWKMAKENILIKTDKNSFMISPYYYLNKSTNSTNSINCTNSPNSPNSVNTVRAVSDTILSPNRENLNNTNENNITVRAVSTVKGIEQKIKCSDCKNFTGENKTAFYICPVVKDRYYPKQEHYCNEYTPPVMPSNIEADFNREEVPF